MITDVGDVTVAGGGRIRGGLVFRISGGLVGPAELGDLDAAGLRRVVDLRGESEDRSVVQRWARSRNVDYVSQPIAAAGREQIADALGEAGSVETATEHLTSIYRTIVDGHGNALATTIGAMADELPAGYGCAAGKDRTGVVTAFLHVLLGVPEAEVARRYVDGAPPAERLRGLARGYLRLRDGDPLPPGVDVFVGAQQATILETLDHVRREYGGVLAYLEAHGLSAEAAEILRERLVAR